MDLERTDELPVLSEDTIAAIRATVRPESGESDLASSVERLCRALDSADERWSHVEAQLAAQNAAIADFRSDLALLSRGPDDEAAAEGREGETDAGTDQASGLKPGPDDDNPYTERIAALERYIAERTDRWQSMEQEVKAKNLRIVELEAEIEQRIAREQDLEQRVEAEGIRADELSERLDLLNRRLEQATLSSEEPTLEPTRLTSRPSVLDLIEEERESASTVSARTGLAELVCLTSDEPHRYVLDKDLVTIGRAPECDIHVPTHFVSRQHAVIRRDNGSLIIEDQRSTNGIFVNAVRVEHKLLEDGDWITIGETQFRFLSGESLD